MSFHEMENDEAKEKRSHGEEIVGSRRKCRIGRQIVSFDEEEPAIALARKIVRAECDYT